MGDSAFYGTVKKQNGIKRLVPGKERIVFLQRFTGEKYAAQDKPALGLFAVVAAEICLHLIVFLVL